MLTGKQKRELKARAMSMKDDCHLGKAGIDAAFTRHLDGLLLRRELVKVRFTELEGSERKELAREVAHVAGAECVSVIGRTMLLYRANPELPAERRVL